MTTTRKQDSDHLCTHPCDDCRPDGWHSCNLPTGHAGYWHTCTPDEPTS